MGQKVTIKLEGYAFTCVHGCCLHHGTIVTVNGKELEIKNDNNGTILGTVLVELGYEPDIIETFNSKAKYQLPEIEKKDRIY